MVFASALEIVCRIADDHPIWPFTKHWQNFKLIRKKIAGIKTNFQETLNYKNQCENKIRPRPIS